MSNSTLYGCNVRLTDKLNFKIDRRPEEQIRRCVRSGLHGDPISKVLSEWLKGSKHPILSISMAHNVVLCKQIQRNTQKIKITDITV